MRTDRDSADVFCLVSRWTMGRREALNVGSLRSLEIDSHMIQICPSDIDDV
jgi:hypothetical protein